MKKNISTEAGAAIGAQTRTAADPQFNAKEFREALGMFATGVTIVTARSTEGIDVGLTASSFNSVSLDPPLVLWSLAQNAGSMPVFAQGAHYTIHVLGAHQKQLAERFARRGDDKFAGLELQRNAYGTPLLECAARFECFNRSQHQEGDHTIFVGQVERLSRDASATPLLYHGGRFYTEHPLGDSGAAPEPSRFVADYLGYLLGQASHAVNGGLEADLQATGLSHAEWRVLAVLHDAQTDASARIKQALPLTQLAREVLAKQPTVTKLVQRMAVAGWVSLRDDAADQRKTLVAPTAAGLKKVAKLVDAAQAHEVRLLASLGSADVAALKRMLRRVQTA
jgi:flavin reductase (DIM6/NTAB) family NADH-FMN oxidoreductase RutF/DNA-binding MarR family transcriptional regulator